MLGQDQGNNIGAAGGGADVEDDGGAHSGQQHREDQFQQFVIGEGLGHGPDGLTDRDIKRQGKGRKHRPAHAADAQEDKAQHHQDHVQHPHKEAHVEPGEHRRQKHRQARGAAEGEVVGGLEPDNAQGRQDQAQVQQGKKAEIGDDFFLLKSVFD